MTDLSSKPAAAEVHSYIDAQSNLELLRFMTCGSVDDGKSTLIGRLLFEAQVLFTDQVAALQEESKRQGTQGGEIDFALLVDGLAAEREQGITIDVAYRFFATDQRQFIVADTPGHEQYTRNMATGASTADLAVILVDAAQGLLDQTRRHSFIASLLGIRHIVLAVNKMDCVDYDEAVYQRIVGDYQAFAKQLTFDEITPIPLSALKGDNIIDLSENTPWYAGPSLLGHLQSVNVKGQENADAMRFPVQWVNRPNADFRGFSGTLAAGRVAPGDRVQVLPSGQDAKIEQIILGPNKLAALVEGQAATLTLDRELDVSRGDVIVSAENPCAVADQFDATMVWMDSAQGLVGRSYWLLLNGNRANGALTEIKHTYNVNNLEHLPAQALNLNDIARVEISLDRSVAFEAYQHNRSLGSFVLVDRYTHATVAAGMINFALRRADNIHPQHSVVDRQARWRLLGHQGKVVWFTGLSGSGKSTIANVLEQRLHQRGVLTYILDGDNVRQGLNRDLGFTDADRVENIRRTAEVAKLLLDAGAVVITAFISPFRSERDMARQLFEPGEFIEVHLDVPLEVVEQRDPKGLYRKVRSGELPHFTGIDSPYEAPQTPELKLDTDALSVEESVERILALID
jgi:bifunctional enzyme CysN/CysC